MRQATMLLVVNPEEVISPTTVHGRSPHLDIRFAINAPLAPEVLSGWLGETLGWVGNANAALAGSDADYQVSDLLAHDFKFSTYAAGSKGRYLATTSGNPIGLTAGSGM